jgi:hypothetical protein
LSMGFLESQNKSVLNKKQIEFNYVSQLIAVYYMF